MDRVEPGQEFDVERVDPGGLSPGPARRTPIRDSRPPQGQEAGRPGTLVRRGGPAGQHVQASAIEKNSAGKLEIIRMSAPPMSTAALG